jgi:hypothetical protein
MHYDTSTTTYPIHDATANLSLHMPRTSSATITSSHLLCRAPLQLCFSNDQRHAPAERSNVQPTVTVHSAQFNTTSVPPWLTHDSGISPQALGSSEMRTRVADSSRSLISFVEVCLGPLASQCFGDDFHRGVTLVSDLALWFYRCVIQIIHTPHWFTTFSQISVSG